MASAMMERAEFPVHRKRTLYRPCITSSFRKPSKKRTCHSEGLDRLGARRISTSNVSVTYVWDSVLSSQSLFSFATRRPAASFRRLRRFRRAHERAHELAIGWRRKRIHVKAFFREKLARIFHPVNPCRLNLHVFESRGHQLVAIFSFFQRSRHAAHP